MKIVVWMPNQPYGGTVLYRLRMPHELMDDVVFSNSINYKDLLGDVLIVCKQYFQQVMPILDKLKKEGVKVVVDYDDYWVLPQDHILYPQYKKNQTTKILTDALRQFDYVIATTELLANEIRGINKNVVVLENSINPMLEQFHPEPTPSNITRFGWIGGHCHLPDIKLLETTPEKLNALSQAWNIYLFGHDGRPGGTYDQFAKVLCSDMKTVDKLKVYRAASSDTYTKFYNLIDVCLVPLRGDKFNSMKSELKMVEAAFFRKGLIVSNVMPYKQWITDKNCLKCNNKQDWVKHMIRMIKNPNLVKDLGEQLYEDLHERFDIRNVNKRRLEFYRSII
jgi:glycosyltransferase involved in cell wall biosynthesis